MSSHEMQPPCSPQMQSLESRRLLSTIGIGIIGDSDSAEYAFTPKGDHARNYVELLGQERGVNFGAYSTKALAAPRGAGYAYNWAQGGDTTTRMFTDGQVAGAAKQAAARQVGIVFINIGFNDLHRAMWSTDPRYALGVARERALNHFKAALASLWKANPKLKIAIATVADTSRFPETRQAVADGELPASASVIAHKVTNRLNAEIAALASGEPRLAVANFAYDIGKMLANPTMKVGGIVMRRGPSTDPDAFLADAMHYGTFAHAILANRLALTLNQHFGTRISPFSTREIANLAGV